MLCSYDCLTRLFVRSVYSAQKQHSTLEHYFVERLIKIDC